ncbi:MAG: LysR family transcriptional regulator [Anaerovoracaceae bacterium]
MTNAEIYAFIAIHEEMNISKAAEKLFISQSSLSTRIKILERELGYQLFFRGKGQRKLTPSDRGVFRGFGIQGNSRKNVRYRRKEAYPQGFLRRQFGYFYSYFSL